tara:strand:+ start:206 stop:1015 length:810 start_codon:yes stop_codon:yes gene_type:complete
MPEAITISEPETGALSPEQESDVKDQALVNEAEQNGPVKFAGKYESVQDLEKGYEELQKKLGSQEEGDKPEVSESKEEAAPANASEIYGEYIGSRLDEAGVDYQGMNTKWQETGKLEDDDYKALEGAGFSKDMVEAYLDGVQYRAEQDSQLAAKEVAAIKNEFGGEQVYNQMIQWASGNLDKGEIDAFNSMLKTSNPHQIRIAVAGIQAAYMNQAPREPKLVGGRTPRANTTQFKSTAQVVAAMNDERYATDEAYRREVQEKLSRSKVL